MLAIARILRTGVTLLLLDEPTEGLAPVIVQRIGEVIRDAQEARLHHPAGRAELPLRRQLADRFYVMEDGQMVVDIPASANWPAAAWTSCTRSLGV